MLNVGIFVRDHVHKPILDIGIQIVSGAERLEADLNAGSGAPHAHGLTSADSNRHRRESRFRIEAANLRSAASKRWRTRGSTAMQRLASE